MVRPANQAGRRHLYPGTLAKACRELGLMTIQRLFIMDSASLRHGVNLLRTYEPDMLEVLPGLVPKAITQLRGAVGKPIIAGE